MCSEGDKCVTKAAHYNAEALIIFKNKFHTDPYHPERDKLLHFLKCL